MNDKFFDLKKGKQDAIINAALKVFAENGYKKASTDEIVKAACISKGLLFHYFGTKKGLYAFIYEYSVRYIVLELSAMVNSKETDFFIIHGQVAAAKLTIMKNYTFLQNFLDCAMLEQNEDVLAEINSRRKTISACYAEIYDRIDYLGFKPDIERGQVMKLVAFIADGCMQEAFYGSNELNLNKMNKDFINYLQMLKRNFYLEEYI